MATALKPASLPKTFEVGFVKRLDQRTELAKRVNKIYRTIIDDLGGIDGLSHTKLTLIERFVWLEAVLQRFEERIARKPSRTDELIGKWIQGMNSLQGLAKVIGLKKSVKSIDLRTYKGRSA